MANLLSRNSLKKLFTKGSFPTETNFSDFIESTVNKVDDGFSKSVEDGLILSPQGNSRRVMSFYQSMRDKKPSWSFNLTETGRSQDISFEDINGNPVMFLREGGNIGFGTHQPMFKLDVDGVAGMRGRVGKYKIGEAPADGKWHTIMDGLTGLEMLEVVARADGRKGRGKYSILHAIALAAHGKSRYGIRKTNSYFGWFWNRLDLRFRGEIDNYYLQVRTWSHYGLDDNKKPHKIKFHVTRLWDDDMFNQAGGGPGIAAYQDSSTLTTDDLGL